MSEKSLTDFNWDDENSFFGVKPETTPEPKEEGKPGEGKPEGDDTPQEEEEDNFFGEKPTDVDTTGDDTPGETGDDTPTGTVYNDLYADLKERGILTHVELEEGEEISAERLLEIQEENYEIEVSNRLNTWAKNDLDEDAQAFIRFKTQGGKTEDFFRTYQSSTDIPEGDLEEEAYQDTVIRYQLRKEGWDSEEIEDRLSYLTEAKKKQAVAKKYDKKIKASSEKEKEALIQQLEKQKQIDKQTEDNFKATLKDTLTNTESVNGFKVTKQDQTELYNMLTRKQYKTDSGAQVTGFQKKMSEVFKDPEKMILLAKLLNSDFDMSSYDKKVVTAQTRKIKTNLEKRQSLRPSNSGSSLGGGSLADLF